MNLTDIAYRDVVKQLQAKDALIKNLLEVVEFYGELDNWEGTTCVNNDNEIIKKYSAPMGGKKARTILNSEEVKRFKEDNC